MTQEKVAEIRSPSVLWVSLNNDQSGCFDAHSHKHYDDDVRYFHGGDFNASYEDLLRAASLREQSAATQMRDACAEAAQQIVFAEMVRLGISAERSIQVSTKAKTTLSSLTLDQVKQEKESK